MKKLIAIAIVFFAFAAFNAQADCTSKRIGRTTFYDCDNGVSGTSREIGSSTFYDFDNGVSGSFRTREQPRSYDSDDQPSGTTYYDFDRDALCRADRIGSTPYFTCF